MPRFSFEAGRDVVGELNMRRVLKILGIKANAGRSLVSLAAPK